MPVLKNAKHERFAQALARGETADQAYQTAGYKRHDGNAARLRGNERVQQRVVEILRKAEDKAEIDIARCLQELVRLGTSDVRKLFDENGNLKPIAELDDATAAAVASVEVVTVMKRANNNLVEVDEELEDQAHGGSLKRKRAAEVEHIHKLKLWDKNSALDKIAKHLGMFIERSEVRIPGLEKLASEMFGGQSFTPKEAGE